MSDGNSSPPLLAPWQLREIAKRVRKEDVTPKELTAAADALDKIASGIEPRKIING